MKGYLWTDAQVHAQKPEGTGRLTQWEAIATEAVGNVIEFWGFKRNQGRVWALLYLRGEPLTAHGLEEELDLSKGGVSMLLRDLERWGVISRLRMPGDSAWRYGAETDLVKMVGRVVEEREASFISRIREDLAEAKRLAAADPTTPPDRLARLERMALLADAVERALRLFLKTARLDASQVFGALRRKPTGTRRSSG